MCDINLKREKFLAVAIKVVFSSTCSDRVKVSKCFTSSAGKPEGGRAEMVVVFLPAAARARTQNRVMTVTRMFQWKARMRCDIPQRRQVDIVSRSLFLRS